MASFAELLDTAIANADSRDQLTASRTRLLAAGDEARRHVVRDLHDGAQQRLVHTIITLKHAQRALHEDRSARRGSSRRRSAARSGPPPSFASSRTASCPRSSPTAGCAPASTRSCRGSIFPVDLDVSRERLPADIEASAYFIVAEALTNVVKHARAARAIVRATLDDGVLTLEVSDDGVGGQSSSATASWASPTASTRLAVGCESKARTATERW